MKMATFRALLFIAALSLVAGCHTLPDTQPFTDASVSLRASVASAGETTVTELKRGKMLEPEKQSQWEQKTAELEQAWKDRNAAMDAMVEYAHSLQEIADAGKKGEEAAKKLAEGATELVNSVGITLPGSGVVSVVTDTGSYIAGQIQAARAAKSLEASLAAVDSFIGQVAAMMMKDMEMMRRTVITAATLQRGDLKFRNQREITYRKQLLASRVQPLESLTAALAAAPESDAEKEAKRKAAEEAASKRVQELDLLIAGTDEWNKAYEADLKSINDRQRAAEEIIANTKASFAVWAEAHSRMLVAVRAKRTPSAAELVEAAKRIQGLVQRYRDLDSPSTPEAPASNPAPSS